MRGIIGYAGRRGALPVLFSCALVAASLAGLVGSAGAAARVSFRKSAPPATIVFEIDVTASVPGQFRMEAQGAFAKAIDRVTRPGSPGAHIYLRKISHDSGSDSARIGEYVIGASPTIKQWCNNPFDAQCKARVAYYQQHARQRAAAAAREIRGLRLPTESAGTTIRGALAAAGAIFDHARGPKWLIAASDMRPSQADPPQPSIRLSGVHVQVLLSCREAFAVCQKRAEQWKKELERAHACSVQFLTSAEGDLLLRPEAKGVDG